MDDITHETLAVSLHWRGDALFAGKLRFGHLGDMVSGWRAVWTLDNSRRWLCDPTTKEAATAALESAARAALAEDTDNG